MDESLGHGRMELVVLYATACVTDIGEGGTGGIRWLYTIFCITHTHIYSYSVQGTLSVQGHA
jgi:hypothetical protein